MSDETSIAVELLEGAATLLNSSFGTALLGAFFGAFAANHFAKRNEHQKALMERLLASNAATSFSIATLEHALGFKAQMSKMLFEDYSTDRQRYIDFREITANAEDKDVVFGVQYEFSPVQMFRTDVDRMLELIALNSGASQRVVMAASTLQQVVASLGKLIQLRTEQLERLSAQRSQLNDDEFAMAYFGVEDDKGNVDVRLLNVVEGLKNQLDDTIFFSNFIAENLSVQNETLAKQLGKSAPDPTKLTLNREKVAGLFPEIANYPDWIE